MLTLHAEAREVRHAPRIRIIRQLRPVRARHAYNLHAHSTAREMGPALRAAEASVDACGCERVAVVDRGCGGAWGGCWGCAGVAEVIRSVGVAFEAADGYLAGRGFDGWCAVSRTALDC